MSLHPVWVGCANCGGFERRELDAEMIEHNVPGEVLAVGCSACGRTALLISRPPWVLNDQDLVVLRVNKIRPE